MFGPGQDFASCSRREQCRGTPQVRTRAGTDVALSSKHTRVLDPVAFACRVAFSISSPSNTLDQIDLKNVSMFDIGDCRLPVPTPTEVLHSWSIAASITAPGLGPYLRYHKRTIGFLAAHWDG